VDEEQTDEERREELQRLVLELLQSDSDDD
jgi:hypothetical protein